MTSSRDSNGAVLWEGRSRLDGSPCVVIATGIYQDSTNGKTGPLGQVWYLDQRAPPPDISIDSLDASTCGDCKRRHSLSGDCYVHLYRGGPFGNWIRWKEGKYPLATEEDFGTLCKRGCRFGAFGEPTAGPYEILERLAQDRWTGFTHQWAKADFQHFRKYCMASVESMYEALLARSLGWRFFRTKWPGDPLMNKEVLCLNESRGLKCKDCGICSGVREGRSGAASVAINNHGNRKSWFVQHSQLKLF